MIFQMILQIIYSDIIPDYIWKATLGDDNDDDAGDSYGNGNDDNNGNMIFLIKIIMILW